MIKILASMNLEHLDVIYTPSHRLLKSDIIEHKKYHYELHKQNIHNEMVGPTHQET